MKLRTKMGLSMAAVFIFFTVAIAISLSGMRNATNRFASFVEHDQALLSATTELYAQGLQMGQALRNIVLDPENEKAYKNFDAAKALFEQAQRRAEDLARQDPQASAALRQIAEMGERQRANQQKAISLAKTDSPDAIKLLTTQETPLWREIRGQLLTMMKTQNEAVQATKAQLDATTQQMLRLSLGIAALAILLGAGVAFWLPLNVMKQLGGEPDYASEVASRIAGGDLTVDIHLDERNTGSLLYAMRTMQQSLASLVARVRSGTETIQTASTEIAAGNQDLSSRTEQQAASLEETASSMEELTSTVRQNAENAVQANQLADAASGIAQRGGQVVSEVVGKMDSINESARKIVDIIGVIDGIAFQTNILALNAAVEAARAGEQGRGFAVVASEVRSLAHRSAAAAKEIKTLIDDSVDKIAAGNQLVEQAGSTMDEVVSSVQRVSNIVAEIAEASGEQSAGIEQVNQAIVQMDQVTQQNAALVEEAAAAAQSMQDQAAELTQIVNAFKLDNRATALAFGNAGASGNAGARLASPEVTPHHRLQAPA